jgi:hypothetical protein
MAPGGSKFGNLADMDVERLYLRDADAPRPAPEDDRRVPLGEPSRPWRPQRKLSAAERHGLAIPIVAQVLAAVAREGVALRLADGNLYLHEGDEWRKASRHDEQWLKVLIQKAAASYGCVLTATTAAAWRRLMQLPELYVRDPAWKAALPPGKAKALAARQPEADNQVREFVRACCVQSDNCKVSNADLLHSFRGWQIAELGEDAELMDVRAFVPRLHAECPWIVVVKVRDIRYAGGVRLNVLGLECWQRRRGVSERKLSFSPEFVNVPWRGRGQRRAFAPAAGAPAGQEGPVAAKSAGG